MTTRTLRLVACLLFLLAANEAFAQGEGGKPPSEGESQKSISLSSSDAPAESEPSKSKPISLGLLIGYGLDFDKGSYNPFGFGLGLRGGYTLDMGVYLGGQFLYFFGDSAGAGELEISNDLITLGAEVGYDIDVQPLVIRPSLGLGLAFTASAASGSLYGIAADGSETEVDMYLAPGVSMIYLLPGFFLGIDLRFVMLTSDPLVKGMTFMATGGINL